MSSCWEPNVKVEDDADGTWFNGGGYIRSVWIAAGSSATSFSQIGVDENLNGTVGFQGEGPFTRIGCAKVNSESATVGQYDDRLGEIERAGGTGHWTPTLRSTQGSLETRSGLTQGSYQKIGKLVFAQCFIYVSGARSPIGELLIGGLPFASAARQPAAIYATQMRLEPGGELQARVDPNERTLVVSYLRGGLATSCAKHVKEDTTLSISITYLANS